MNEFYLRNNRRIIDSFIFFNEFDMIKFRLEYLNEIVDNFIICESNYTFSGKKKPYYLDQIINDIPEEIRKKIIRIKYEPDIETFNFPNKVTEYDYENDYWRLEKEQRNFISKNLSSFSSNDFMMLSDVDEIPKKTTVLQLAEKINDDLVYVSECEFFYYNFKTFLHDKWLGTLFSKVENFISNGSEYLRNERNSFIHVEKSGWHFSYFNEIDQIERKIDSFSHQEYNNETYKNNLNIINSIKNKTYLFDKNYTFSDYYFFNFPKEIRDQIIKHFPSKYYTKIFIFGSDGMLGKYLTEYLSSDFEVIPITRNIIDLNDDFSKISEKYIFSYVDVIINAAGIIKQRKYSSQELIKINSLFPHFLSTLKCNVIHITTDCVFSGRHGLYNEDSPHDCLDDYGKSKSLGECEDLTIIRTSIIGEEIKNKKSLIEWVKSSQNTTINGYINHFWNGVTCLELSKHIENIIKNNCYWKGVRHYFSPNIVSKYQLVSYINEIYELNNNVIPLMSEYCDRSLSTKFDSPVKLTIKEQILELKNFNVTNQFIEKEKLKDFPTINFVSLSECKNRREVLDQKFKDLNLHKIVPHIFERYTNYNHQINFGPYEQSYEYDLSYLGAFTSHLKAIREWYNSTDEEYAIFCEDDISFETVKYWNFSWKEFFNRLPINWECVQLSLSRDNMFLFFQPEVHFRNRCWCDWSCVAYLIKRSHAKNLIDNYMNGDTFSFDYIGIDKNIRSDWDLRPTLETVIYTCFKENSIYAFPLFVENIDFNSTVWDSNDKTYYSYETIMNWWKTKGNHMDLNDIFIGG